MKKSFLPFRFEDWDPCGDSHHIFYKCHMTRDFSALKEGESYASISIDFDEGKVEAYQGQDDEEPTYTLRAILEAL